TATVTADCPGTRRHCCSRRSSNAGTPTGTDSSPCRTPRAGTETSPNCVNNAHDSPLDEESGSYREANTRLQHGIIDRDNKCEDQTSAQSEPPGPLCGIGGLPPRRGGPSSTSTGRHAC